MTAGHRLLTRVALRNYKSIAACDVTPANLCFLVGPNGSGKSNFLDALRFVRDSLRHSIDHALRDRGGINDVRRRSSGHPTHFGIRVEVDLEESHGHYAFTVGAKRPGGYEVQREECLVVPRDGGDSDHYRVEKGEVRKSSLLVGPVATPDRLYLVSVSGHMSFRRVYDALSTLGFYNLNPQEIRQPQPPDPGELLSRDGSNIASVLSNLSTRSPDAQARIEDYLSSVVPGIAGVARKMAGPRETLEFRQEVRGAKHPWKFEANNVSDGTLRALGILVAVFQGAGNGRAMPGLVGIEEPEVALHPAAAGVLIDSLRDAAERIQILVTSHSPDLLDDEEISADSILAVRAEHGESRIGPLDEAGRSALREHMFTAGELLRIDQLDPDPALSNPKPSQIRLFGSEP
ncbi:MAG: AAA family ATPase [Acidobacteriota bacterium]|nr:AAA family ATPase [Acidobacteriota bacterium]